MAIFVGSNDPATRAAARQWNADEQAFHRHRARLGLGSSAALGSDLRGAVARKLGLGDQATSEEIYQAALRKLREMAAEGERRAKRDEARIGSEIDEAVGRFPSSRSSALGASHAHVIGLALAREARRLVACGDAPNLAEAQRMAVRADPSILRR